MNVRALSFYYLEPYFQTATDLEPWITWWVPYSFPGYFALLFVTWLVKKALGPKFVINQPLQFVHNMFLCFQSVVLVALITFGYFDTAERAGLDPFTFDGLFNTLLTRPERYENVWFDIAMAAFLLSKLYEQVLLI